MNNGDVAIFYDFIDSVCLVERVGRFATRERNRTVVKIKNE